MAAQKILMLVGDFVVNETASNAHTDGRLVTAPAWPAHPQWIRLFLEVLGSRIEP